MINKNILLCGLCRNIEVYFDKVFANIDTIKKIFARVDILFIENDSTDKTRHLLKNRNDARVIYFNDLVTDYPQRTARIAFCRNQILKEAIENPRYADIDYILWMDMDDICINPINQNAIESNDFSSDWGMKCAFKDTGYYDIWALRHPIYSPDDCIHNLVRDGWHNQWAHEKHVHSRMRQMNELRKSEKLIEVDSAFGGMGFVNKKYLTSNVICQGVDTYGREKCEWVSFCEGIRKNGGKIFVNCEFII